MTSKVELQQRRDLLREALAKFATVGGVTSLAELEKQTGMPGGTIKNYLIKENIGVRGEKEDTL